MDKTEKGITESTRGGVPHEHTGRDNNFNFLRLLLALLVIVSHAPEIIDGNRKREIFSRIFHSLSFGELAVDGFFLLSGFLIVQSWQRQPHFTSFLKKRVLRIYPAFVVASIVSAFVVGPLATNGDAYFASFKPLAFIVGITLLKAPVVPLVFTGMHYQGVNEALWTISQEFRCYLLVPCAHMAGLLRDRKRWFLFSIVVLFCSVVAPPLPYRFMHGYFWKIVLPDGPEHTFRLLTFFCSGGCFYLFRNEIKLSWGWMVIALVILVPCLYHDRSAQVGLATAGAYVLLWFAFADIQMLNLFRSHSDVSYGIYLYGWPVQSLLILYFQTISPWIDCTVAIVICWGFGWLSWHFVELPFLRMKPKQVFKD